MLSDSIDHQGVSGRPATVDRRLCRACSSRDFLDAETLEADIRQRVERRFDDGLVERRILRSSGPLRFVRGAGRGIRGQPRHIRYDIVSYPIAAAEG